MSGVVLATAVGPGPFGAGRRLLAALACAAILLAAAIPAGAESRHALVVGNAGYAVGPLPNARNDAEALARVLAGVGFTVTKLVDADNAGLRRAVADLGRRLRETGDVGLFFFAGHGVQIDGENYLVPVGADIRQARDVVVEGLALGEVMKAMDGAAGRMSIIILDACRNNPFVTSERTVGLGLAPASAPAGTLIAYSTAPGKVALDGDGAMSPYSQALAQAIPTPGVALEEVFKRTRRQVIAATKGAQTPWEHSSLTREFQFHASSAEPEAGGRPRAAAEPRPQELEELRAWERIKATTNAALIRRHLETWPNGLYAELARHKLAQLAAQATNAETLGGWLGSVLGPPAGDAQAEKLFAEAVKLEARGTPEAQADAFAKLRAAADRGLPAALYRVGRAYDKGFGVERNLTAAAAWYARAVEKGSGPAMAALGTMREFGDGAAPDLAEAVRLYRLAAEAGDPAGMTSLGYLHHQGRGVTRDFTQARRWYARAAEQGNARAMFNLALMHIRSEGGEQDVAAAAKLLQAAVDKGHAGAMRELAFLHDEGRGVGRDRRAAARLLLAAFKAGHKDARVDLLVRPEAWSAETRREVQRLLVEAGHLRRRGSGTFGLETRRALEAYARAG